MTQEIITYIIVAFVFGVIVHKTYRLLRRGRSPQSSKCGSCCGCDLRDQIAQKEKSCKEFEPRKKH